MAISYYLSLSPLFVSCILAFFDLCSCRQLSKPVMNSSTTDIEWSPAGATWYGGSPNGAASEGGACGYGNAVSKPPFSSLITAISPSLFKTGKGCGVCYEVKCTTNPACSGKPMKVVVTDLCPGGPCSTTELTHFDLSGPAFDALANPGEEDKLRGVGVLQIDHARVECDYPATTYTLSFTVDQASKPYYFAILIEGPGIFDSVDLKDRPSSTGPDDQWKPMQLSWDSVWKLDTGSPLQAPFSLRWTYGYGYGYANLGRTVVVNDLIPVGWQPGATYLFSVNDI